MTSEELADLAFDIADESAASLVDSVTIDVEVDGEKWLSFRDDEMGDQYREDCANEIDYLEARGLLHRHPAQKHLVRIEEGWR